jgi:hypothetical protein
VPPQRNQCEPDGGHGTSLSLATVALKDFDMRVVNVSRSSAGLSYRVQILKHYDFHADQDFTIKPHGYNITVPGLALSRLPSVGLARDFDVIGTSAVMTQ